MKKAHCCDTVFIEGERVDMNGYSIEIIEDMAFRKYRGPGIIEYDSDGKTVRSVQYIYRFPNKRGAIIAKNDSSIGHSLDLWELTVTAWDEKGDYPAYSFPMSSKSPYEYHDGIIAPLNNRMVHDLLGKIICM